MDFLFGVIETSGSSVIVGKAVKLLFLHLIPAQDSHTDIPAMYLPEMLCIFINIRHH